MSIRRAQDERHGTRASAADDRIRYRYGTYWTRTGYKTRRTTVRHDA